ncbi:YHS domain protein [Sulfitobacter sp. S223]|uniref:YHS domain-containing (seleno)protein n=1 Tax=Sulfitobacter sp. S223 TaxID=2867023 RepID=UPI0021A2C78B|nr:YHS domain-containing (seleno)protein [Sulfitobacter sp. S223]UWR25405.1 YHS domain protein [Sulfitobacter sp. S223]
MTLFSRRKMMLSGAAIAAFSPLQLSAATVRVSINDVGAAIDGYDTTAYWQIAAAQTGAATHTVSWSGATWQFSSQNNADMFAAAPIDFAPQFGGFCTRAMSFGKVVNGDPEVWRIYEGKLYLFARPIGGEKFDEGPDPIIGQAQDSWDLLD